ncbi:MAG: hypothetical protein HY343_12020 [Lentisphaerae bacterium]|nr:hypothetical protein [Lentisphaerota bacterium]
MAHGSTVHGYIVLALLLAAGGLGLVGCEVNSADQSVRISPDTARIRYGEAVVLTADRGYFFHWTLENEEWGQLSSRSGNPVTYTSYYAPGTSAVAVQVITVASTYTDSTGTGGSSGSSPSTTNGTSTITDTAQAHITHYGD